MQNSEKKIDPGVSQGSVKYTMYAVAILHNDLFLFFFLSLYLYATNYFRSKSRSMDFNESIVCRIAYYFVLYHTTKTEKKTIQSGTRLALKKIGLVTSQ